MKLVFSEQAWEDYLYWQKIDKKLVQRINGLIKEISHPRGAYSDEHFYKFGSAQIEKLHARLAGSRPGQQGLSGARRPNQ